MKKPDETEIRRRFQAVDSYLSSLVDSDPEHAIIEARALGPDRILDIRNTEAIKAGILIDAGNVVKNVEVVREGVEILQGLRDVYGTTADIRYCLGNGLNSLARLHTYTTPQWYLETAKPRHEARCLYSSEVRSRAVSTQALTELASSLLMGWRFFEAYDCYLRALDLDPHNGVALTGAAKVLLYLVNDGIGNRDILLGVAAKHLKIAKENPDRIRKLAGVRAYQELLPLLETKITGGVLPDLSSASDYQRFIAKHRLALTPTIEGLDLTITRWDSLRIESIIESIDTEHGVPPLFSMFNVLKSDYLAARFLAYSALNNELPESGKYSDTLDYAIYGIRPSMLTLAQRACMDILDKTAVATSEYLNLPGSSDSIYFKTRWFKKRKDGEPWLWQQEIQQEIESGNTGLIALCEVAMDVAKDGFLNDKSKRRHASTHRFAVLHDFGEPRYRECKYITHYEEGDFTNQLIETLQLTRAVLFYFVETVRQREKRIAVDDSKCVRLTVPDHDWIRGEEE